MLTIITSVAASLLALAIGFVLKSRFEMRPELHIQVLSDGVSHTPFVGSKVRITWHYRLKIHNPPDYRAFNISIIWPKNARKLPISTPNPPHIGPQETKEQKFDISKEFPTEQVTACTNCSEELRPPELKNFVLILQYQNIRIAKVSAFTHAMKEKMIKKGVLFTLLNPRIDLIVIVIGALRSPEGYVQTMCRLQGLSLLFYPLDVL
jgi:hypothetical protein